MKTSLVALFVVLASTSAMACSKGAPPDDSFKNDLTMRKPGAAPVNARGGIADDTIKPGPVPAPINARGGIADDTIKPAPVRAPINGQVRTNDDGIKPGPRPTR